MSTPLELFPLLKTNLKYDNPCFENNTDEFSHRANQAVGQPICENFLIALKDPLT